MQALTHFESILAMVTITAFALVALRLARFPTRQQRSRAGARDCRARAYLSVLQALTQKTGGLSLSSQDQAHLLDLARSHGLSEDEVGHLEFLLQRPTTRARLQGMGPRSESPGHSATPHHEGSDPRYLFISFQAEIQKARDKNQPLTLLTLSLLTTMTGPGGSEGAPEERHIRRMAHLIRGQLRGCDTCIRHATSEFIILLPGISKTEAPLVENRLRIALQGATFSQGPRGTSRSRIILGSATSPEDGNAFEQLLAIADQQRLRDGASIPPPRAKNRPRPFVLDNKSLTRN